MEQWNLFLFTSSLKIVSFLIAALLYKLSDLNLALKKMKKNLGGDRKSSVEPLVLLWISF